MLLADLWDRWKRWCAREGRDRVGDVQNFSRALRSCEPNLTVARPRLPDGTRPRVYQGIRLVGGLL